MRTHEFEKSFRGRTMLLLLLLHPYDDGCLTSNHHDPGDTMNDESEGRKQP